MSAIFKGGKLEVVLGLRSLALWSGCGSGPLLLRLGRLRRAGRAALVVDGKAVTNQKVFQVFVRGRFGCDLAHEVGANLLSHVAFVDLELLLLNLSLQLLITATGYDSESGESKAGNTKDQRDDKLPHFHEKGCRVLRRGNLLLVTGKKPSRKTEKLKAGGERAGVSVGRSPPHYIYEWLRGRSFRSGPLPGKARFEWC